MKNTNIPEEQFVKTGKNLFPIMASLFLMSMVACGDDVTNVTAAAAIATYDGDSKLPVCDAKNSGEMAFSSKDGVVFLCDGKNWNALNESPANNQNPGPKGEAGKDGNDGDDCSIEQDGDIVTITCGKSDVSINIKDYISNPSSDSKPANKVDPTAGSQYDKNSNTLKDLRDGKTYKTVTLGKQTWMAENLNYNDGIVGNSYCYGFSKENCDVYGRLYSQAGAFNVNKFICDANGCYVDDFRNRFEEIRGICPQGWHIPNNREWKMLIDFVKANSGTIDMGAALRSKYDWADPGLDLFGLNMLPGGSASISGNFSNIGERGYWISSSYADKLHFSSYALESLLGLQIQNGNQSSKSIRCVMDCTEGENCPTKEELEFIPNEDFKGNYGKLIDSRDKQEYKTVVIGNQTWMAENLNYNYKDGNHSFCFADDPYYCTKYGRLYTWLAAIGKAEECNPNEECKLDEDKIQGICPDGWRLPNRNDFVILISQADPEVDLTKDFVYSRKAAVALLDVSFRGGENLLGFSAQLSGDLFFHRHDYNGFGSYGRYYGSDSDFYLYSEKYGYEENNYNANSSLTSPTECAPTMAFAVRCIKADD